MNSTILKNISEDDIYINRFITDSEVNYLISNSSCVLIDYDVTNSGVATLACVCDSKIIFRDFFKARDFIDSYGYQKTFYFKNDHLKKIKCGNLNAVTMSRVSELTEECFINAIT